MYVEKSQPLLIHQSPFNTWTRGTLWIRTTLEATNISRESQRAAKSQSIVSKFWIISWTTDQWTKKNSKSSWLAARQQTHPHRGFASPMISTSFRDPEGSRTMRRLPQSATKTLPSLDEAPGGVPISPSKNQEKIGIYRPLKRSRLILSSQFVQCAMLSCVKNTRFYHF